MSEAKQIKLKDAAERLQYSVATVRRMVKRGILPSTGSGPLLRIPVDAIDAKIARMAEGEELWHGARLTPASDASGEAVAFGKTKKPANGGAATKTKKATTAGTVQLVGRPPKRF